MSGNTIVITGGAGFLGSHLCERALKDGFGVVCVDNLITGSTDNISHLDEKGFVFINCDVSNGEIVEHIKKGANALESKGYGKPSCLVHMASPASPADFERFSVEILHVNSFGTQNMINASMDMGARFIMASTSEVYGNPLESPQSENYFGNVNPVGIRSCYDESKRFSEALISSYWRKNCLEGIIIRIFNTYGPKMRLNDGRAIPNFLLQAIKKEPLSIYGDGSQTRCFCYVDDMTEAFWKAILSTENRQVINVGSEIEITINELASSIEKACGFKLQKNYHPMPSDDPERRRPDISRAKEILEWFPQTDLEYGLERTYKWFLEKAKSRIGS